MNTAAEIVQTIARRYEQLAVEIAGELEKLSDTELQELVRISEDAAAPPPPPADRFALLSLAGVARPLLKARAEATAANIDSQARAL